MTDQTSTRARAHLSETNRREHLARANDLFNASLGLSIGAVGFAFAAIAVPPCSVVSLMLLLGSIAAGREAERACGEAR
ncbi:hypothetical protein [Burkholderia gladioli]|uniref:hypothetical protein n=1 Tax=Burkholderia gladioli TaxID=28095 RepID=UPI0015E6A91E|nr:hypothetical protein [Burkholderia gladioli]MBA1366231.1 hypothetical protein [Burkholderia gladioli]